MFTGLVQALGVVESLQPTPAGRRLVVSAAAFPAPKAGDSVAVSGCCLTQVGEALGGRLTFDVVPETLEKTTLGALAAGDAVNLEACVTPTTALGGHLVQGHVDGVGEVRAVERAAGAHLLRIGPPAAFAAWLLPQGSVTVAGVSLTVARLEADGSFAVALIPETLERTTLGRLRPGDRVNLEGDMLVKAVALQVERQLALRAGAAKRPVDAGLLRAAGWRL